MSEPAIPHASLSATGYEDGLGRRTLEFDREAGGMLERLHLRAEFGAFEASMRQRMDRLAACEDARVARVRAVERTASGVSVLSAYVAGDRLCDLLEAATNLPAHEATSPTVDAALGFLLEALPALAAIHSSTAVAHGALSPGRITLTASGDVVLLDTMYGDALQRLQYNRRRLWADFGLAMPPGSGPARFDQAADTSQAALIAMMIVLGRPFRPDDYPDALPALIAEVIEIAQIRGSARFASGLHKFLHRALPLPARRPHASADEAAAEVRQVAKEIGAARCRAALTAFVGDMNRVISDAREQRLAEHEPSIEVPFAPTPDVTFAIDEPTALHTDPIPDEQVEITAENAYQPVPPREVVEDARDFVRDVAERAGYESPAPEPVAVHKPEPVVFAAAEPEYSPPVAEEPVREPEPVFVAAVPPIEVAPAAIAYEPPPLPVVAAEPPAPPPPMAAVAPPPPVVESPMLAAPEPQSVPAPAPAPMPETPQPATAAKQRDSETDRAPAESKRKRHNARRHRDKLRSNAAPPPPPAAPARPAVPPPAAPRMPVYDAPVAAAPAFAPPPAPPRKTAQPLRDDAPLAVPVVPVTPVRIEPPAASPHTSAPLAFKSDLPRVVSATASAPLAFRNEPAAGFAGTARSERRESHDMTAVPYVERGFEEPRKRTFPWRLVAAAVVVIGVGIGAGRKYLPSSDAAEAAPMPSSEVVAAAKEAAAAEKSGTVVLTTEPAGAHVLLDGKEMGDSPLTLENVPAGKHALTFVTASASVKKIVRVEAGKTVGLDVAVFSGWIAVFSPIPLDISENGRAIGSSEQGRLMLSPGRHRLTLTNTELGYSDVKIVDIEPGEEHPLSVEPAGVLSANAVPWAEVWMNGKKIGETPVARLVVPLGTYEVVFKNPQFPERRVSVTVTATTPVTASVDFSK